MALSYLFKYDYTLLCFSGPDVWQLLQGALSNDIHLLKTQKSIRAFHLSPKGKWIARLLLFLKDEKIYALCFRNEAELLKQSMKNLLFLSSSQLQDLHDTHEIFLQVTDDETTLLAEGIRDDEWQKAAAWLIVPKTEVDDFLQKHSFQKATVNEAEEFRSASKINRYGFEVDEKSIPPLVGYGDDYFSYNKGCYVGQEVISRIKHYGKKS